MNRRSLASVSVFCLLVALLAVAAFVPVPYVTESPGPTINVLGTSKDKPIISVTGHKTYPTQGDLRLTTVSVTNPTHRIGLGEAMAAWFDGARAVYPRDVIYPPQQSADEVEKQSAVEMVSSQDTAVVAALRALGYDLPATVKVVAVTKGAPAQGRLRSGDVITRVDGRPTTERGRGHPRRPGGRRRHARHARGPPRRGHEDRHGDPPHVARRPVQGAPRHPDPALLRLPVRRQGAAR